MHMDRSLAMARKLKARSRTCEGGGVGSRFVTDLVRELLRVQSSNKCDRSTLEDGDFACWPNKRLEIQATELWCMSWLEKKKPKGWRGEKAI